METHLACDISIHFYNIWEFSPFSLSLSPSLSSMPSPRHSFSMSTKSWLFNEYWTGVRAERPGMEGCSGAEGEGDALRLTAASGQLISAPLPRKGQVSVKRVRSPECVDARTCPRASPCGRPSLWISRHGTNRPPSVPLILIEQKRSCVTGRDVNLSTSQQMYDKITLRWAVRYTPQQNVSFLNRE